MRSGHQNPVTPAVRRQKFAIHSEEYHSKIEIIGMEHMTPMTTYLRSLSGIILFSLLSGMKNLEHIPKNYRNRSQSGTTAELDVNQGFGHFYRFNLANYY